MHLSFSDDQSKQKLSFFEAIFILRVCLEYHECLMLGIDRRDTIAQELRTHHEWRQLKEKRADENSEK